MHCWNDTPLTLVRSPPAWSIPHSTMNLRPFEVTSVLLAAGQARPEEAPPEAVGVLRVLEVLLPVGWTQSGLVNTVSLLPAPQYCIVSFAQVMLHSPTGAIVANGSIVLPQ
jgi:hypothetical protein